LERRPGSLPRVVRFGGHDAREVHYVTRDVFRALELRFRDTLRSYGQPPLCSRDRFRYVRMHGESVGIDDTCTDEVTKAWRSVRAAIEEAARSEAASAAERDAPIDDCSAVRDMPWTIGADQDNGRVELVYAGWIPPLRDPAP
jgi:hypothetical protein